MAIQRLAFQEILHWGLSGTTTSGKHVDELSRPGIRRCGRRRGVRDGAAGRRLVRLRDAFLELADTRRDRLDIGFALRCLGRFAVDAFGQLLFIALQLRLQARSGRPAAIAKEGARRYARRYSNRIRLCHGGFDAACVVVPARERQSIRWGADPAGVHCR